MKTCPRCHEDKTLDGFSPDKRTKDGRTTICKKCAATWRRNRWLEGPKPTIVTPAELKCSSCGSIKSSDDFYKDSRYSTGRQQICKKCQGSAMRDLYRKNPFRYLIRSAKARAKAFGVPFDLKEGDLVIPDCCPVLGIRLTPVREGLVNRPSSPSLDRIIPELGYVRGNVTVISWRANSIKRDATVDEIEKLLHWMRAVCTGDNCTIKFGK